MKSFKTLVLLLITISISNANAQYVSYFENELIAFEKLDSITPPSSEGTILFTGSSSIRFWKDPKGDFNDEMIINRGFGGSQIVDLIEQFDRIIYKYNPKTVVVYSGDNDINAGKSAEKVFGDFCVMYGMIKNKLPDTKVVYIAIKPSIARWKLSLEMLKANTMIYNYLNTESKGSYVDVYSIMIGTDGLPKKEYFIHDGLHMTPEGYELWTEAVAPHLK